MRLLRLLSMTVSVIVLTASCVESDRESGGKEFVKVGDAIPAFSVSGPFAGYETFSSEAFDGKRGLIVFFVSYCPDCHIVMPKIEEIWKAKDEIGNFEMAVISRMGGYETLEGLDNYWYQRKAEPPAKDTPLYTMPYYIDTDWVVYNKFAEKTIPRIYLIDTSGKVVRKWVEKMSESSAELRNLIEEL